MSAWCDALQDLCLMTSLTEVVSLRISVPAFTMEKYTNPDRRTKATVKNGKHVFFLRIHSMWFSWWLFFFLTWFGKLPINEACAHKI